MSGPPEGAVEAQFRLVLVGESEPIRAVREQLARGFGAASVTAVPTPADAIDRIEEADCVLCEPGAVSTLADAAPAPIVAITAGDGTEAIETGAVDVLSPTASVAVVRARIRSVVSGTPSSRADRYRTIFEASDAVVLLLDGNGTIEWASPAIDRSLEYTPAELEGEDLPSIVHPDDRETVSEQVRALAAGRLDDRSRVSCRLRLGSGRVGRYELDVRNRLSDPALAGFVCTIRPAGEGTPVDPDRAADSDVAAGAAGGLDAIGDPVVRLDEDWVVTAANEAAAELLTAESPIGREFWELLPPETLSTWFEELAAVRTRDARDTFEVPAADDGGRYSVTAYPAPDGLTVLARERAETAVSRMQSELDATAAVLDAVPTPAFLLDTDDRVSIANAAAFDYTDRATVVGHRLETILDESVASAVSERANATVRRVDPIEWTPTVGATERTVELSVVPLPDDRAVVVGLDVTRRRRLAASVDALTEAFGTLEESATVDETRGVLTAGIRAAFGASVAVWYRRDDGQLSPLRTAGLPDDRHPPPISMTDSRLASLVPDGPTPLGPDERIPVGDGRVIVEPIAIPVADAAVVIVGDADASPTGTGGRPAEREGGADALSDSTSPGRGSDVEGADASVGTPAAGQFPEPATRESAAAPPVGPSFGRNGGGRLESVGGLIGELAPLSLSRAACRVENRELATELAEADRFRATVDAVSDRRDAINRTLRTAETRTALESGLCRELTELDAVKFAVVAGVRNGEIDLRATAGSVPSALADDAAQTSAFVEPIRSAHDGQRQIVESIGGDRFTDLGAIRSVVATPIAGTNRTHGILAAYLADHQEPGVLSTLCADVATGGFLAIDSIETREALLADDTVELELSIPASEESVLLALVREGTTTVDVDAVATGDGESTFYVTIRESSGSTPDAVLESHPQVRGFDRREPKDEAVRYEIAVDRQPLVDAVASYGGVIATVSGRDGTATVRVEVPADRDVRSVVEAVRAVVPNAELAARRPTGRGQEPRADGREILADLTERQREILRTAYAAGYFEFPRERTGEEIASQLDISQPTFTRHFRAAERTVFDTLFGE